MKMKIKYASLGTECDNCTTGGVYSEVGVDSSTLQSDSEYIDPDLIVDKSYTEVSNESLTASMEVNLTQIASGGILATIVGVAGKYLINRYRKAKQAKEREEKERYEQAVKATNRPKGDIKKEFTIWKERILARAEEKGEKISIIGAKGSEIDSLKKAFASNSLPKELVSLLSLCNGTHEDIFYLDHNEVSYPFFSIDKIIREDKNILDEAEALSEDTGGNFNESMCHGKDLFVPLFSHDDFVVGVKGDNKVYILSLSDLDPTTGKFNTSLVADSISDLIYQFNRAEEVAAEMIKNRNYRNGNTPSNESYTVSMEMLNLLEIVSLGAVASSVAGLWYWIRKKKKNKGNSNSPDYTSEALKVSKRAKGNIKNEYQVWQKVIEGIYKTKIKATPVTSAELSKLDSVVGNYKSSPIYKELVELLRITNGTSIPLIYDIHDEMEKSDKPDGAKLYSVNEILTHIKIDDYPDGVIPIAGTSDGMYWLINFNKGKLIYSDGLEYNESYSEYQSNNISDVLYQSNQHIEFLMAYAALEKQAEGDNVATEAFGIPKFKMPNFKMPNLPKMPQIGTKTKIAGGVLAGIATVAGLLMAFRSRKKKQAAFKALNSVKRPMQSLKDEYNIWQGLINTIYQRSDFMPGANNNELRTLSQYFGNDNTFMFKELIELLKLTNGTTDVIFSFGLDFIDVEKQTTAGGKLLPVNGIVQYHQELNLPANLIPIAQDDYAYVWVMDTTNNTLSVYEYEELRLDINRAQPYGDIYESITEALYHSNQVIEAAIALANKETEQQASIEAFLDAIDADSDVIVNCLTNRLK